jgi:hypothetical protein
MAARNAESSRRRGGQFLLLNSPINPFKLSKCTYDHVHVSCRCSDGCAGTVRGRPCVFFGNSFRLMPTELRRPGQKPRGSRGIRILSPKNRVACAGANFEMLAQGAIKKQQPAIGRLLPYIARAFSCRQAKPTRFSPKLCTAMPVTVVASKIV